MSAPPTSPAQVSDTDDVESWLRRLGHGLKALRDVLESSDAGDAPVDYGPWLADASALLGSEELWTLLGQGLRTLRSNVARLIPEPAPDVTQMITEPAPVILDLALEEHRCNLLAKFASVLHVSIARHEAVQDDMEQASDMLAKIQANGGTHAIMVTTDERTSTGDADSARAAVSQIASAAPADDVVHQLSRALERGARESEVFRHFLLTRGHTIARALSKDEVQLTQADYLISGWELELNTRYAEYGELV